ncbi:MAG: AbrB/MazE/SpoVT family DNA-binding domain-containing protein [Chthoniobacterales bacterium]
MTTTISSKGQVTVPVELRELLGLTPGTKLAFEAGPRGTLVARKASQGSFFAKFRGAGKKASAGYRDSQEAMDALRGPVEKGDVD